MKTFLKTVSLTLAISVTMLFFSSYKKVEAAGTGTAVAIDAGLYIIAAIATGIASCLTVEVITELNEFVESNYFADSFTKDEEGLFSYHPLSDNQQMDAVVEAAVAQYNNKVKNNEISSGDTSSSLSSETYSDCVSSGLKDVLGSGAASGITSGISVINGKPQKVTTTYTKSTVEVFDYLGFDYVTFDSLNDFHIDCSTGDSSYYYTPYIITTDNTLYKLSQSLYMGDYYSDHYNVISFLSGQHYLRTHYDTYNSFRFYESNGIFCAALYISGLDVNNELTRVQYIYSDPKLTSYPVLFSDKLSYKKIASTSLNNNATNAVYFENVTTGYNGDSKKNADIFSLDILQVGYIYTTTRGGVDGASLKSAADMLSGTENAVQGGTNTTYSELSDIEKAIYALAKQQGITYEEMLEQSNLVVENGQIYLEGLDGVTHSIESLLAEFDKLLEQGDITNENIAASTEQLKAILDYLKGLNIEGLGSYIQQLETTLDGLKQGDEDREAVLGDISGQLTDLILTLFVRDPVPPVFTVPIKADINAFGLDQSVDEEIVLDLTVFKVNGVDIVQVVLNFVCILGFVLMLIHTTTKFFV